MTVTQNDARSGEYGRRQMDAIHEDAELVREIAAIAEEQLGETEAERYGRVHYEEALRNLLWDMEAPWSEHTASTDRVLRTPKGDLDELRLMEFLRRVLGEPVGDGKARKSQTARQARQEMDKDRKLARIGAARSGVASRMDGWATSFETSSSQPREASPVHRGELPPAQTAPVRSPEQPALPPRLVPVAPPESPAETTSQMVAIVEKADAAGTLDERTRQFAAKAGFGKQTPAGAPSFAPSPDPAFGAAAIPAQRHSIADTVTMHADEVLAELAKADAGAEAVPPFPSQLAASRVDGSSPDAAKPAGSVSSGSRDSAAGGSDD